MESRLNQIIQKIMDLPTNTARISLRQPLSYQSNRLYDIWVADQHWIAKEYLKPDEFGESPRREFDALNKLLLLDIAPKPIHFAPHNDSHNPIVIYDYMEGDMWDRYSPTAEEMGQLADVWQKMNNITADVAWTSRGQERTFESIYAQFQSHLQRYDDWVSSDFRAGEKAIALCWQICDESRPYVDELAEHDPHLLFCRADPRFANVIRRPDGRLGMVDWEDSGLRDAARDITDMMAHPNQEDLVLPAQWDDFLRPYLATIGDRDPHIRQRIQLYHALTPLFWLGLLLNALVNRPTIQGFDGWEINGMPAQQRLRRYLARSLAYPNADFSRQLSSVRVVQFFPE
jgi:hypothetical protein